MPVHAPTYTPADLGHAIEKLRTSAPLVQCLTNAVVTNFTANVLLAAGASPAMVDVPGEAAAFAPVASAVLVNLGTPHAEQRRAMLEAARSARTAGIPWVLDPVAVGFLEVRTQFAAELLAERPTVVRGNASEIPALAGSGAGGRGVDATDNVEAALPSATHLAASCPTVVAVSGPVDLVTDAGRTVRVHGGDPLLTRVTGGGCSLGALVAAMVAANDGDALLGTIAAHALYSVAAERAAATATGPGSFAVGFLDTLAATGPQELSTAAVLA
ncbi:hydroxyethylthiazole kinase [Arthrobacter sp. JSM 101049]|uniref:hydroxyethylthiazole kinase n=1 Tax=Arthrobacter sp. JSM 101049 TaxID=929097 RepID=UPI00356873A0